MPNWPLLTRKARVARQACHPSARSRLADPAINGEMAPQFAPHAFGVTACRDIVSKRRPATNLSFDLALTAGETMGAVDSVELRDAIRVAVDQKKVLGRSPPRPGFRA